MKSTTVIIFGTIALGIGLIYSQQQKKKEDDLLDNWIDNIQEMIS